MFLILEIEHAALLRDVVLSWNMIFEVMESHGKFLEKRRGNPVCVFTSKERKKIIELRERLGLEPVSLVIEMVWTRVT